MEIKTLIILILTIFLPQLACTPGNSGSTATNTNRVSCPSGSELNAAGTKCLQKTDVKDIDQDTDDPFDRIADNEDLIPNFDTADIDGRFNRENLAVFNLPEEFEEANIIAKRTEYHRRIWWDQRAEGWTSFASSNNSGGNRMSTHQPIQDPSILSFYDEPLQFYLGGHTQIHGLEDPCNGTLIMTPSPFIEENQTALAPPLDYEEIYTQIGRTSEEEFNKCLDHFEQLQKMEIFLPKVELEEKCDILFQGLAEANYQFNGQYNNGFDLLFQKESVAIWRPKPQEGYKCLGDATTNGNNNKPFTEQDHAQGIADTPVNFRYAMYCVKEEFVVKGKLDINSMITDGNVSIFKIINDEENAPDGYAYGNFFYTRRGPAPSTTQALNNLEKNTDVWVLNKKKAVFIADAKKLKRDEDCPADPAKK